MGRNNVNPPPEPSTSNHIHLPHVHMPGHSSKTTTTSANRTNSNGKRLQSSGSANYGNNSKASGANIRGDGRGITRENSMQTRYVQMLLGMDTIPRLHNILASFFTWILLAGFIIFPGTFTALGHVDNSSQAAQQIFKSIKNIPLLVIAGVCCGIGAGGMLWLWWTWRANYTWLLNKIFLPGCLNSFAGLISTIINVYTQQSGVWSVTAKVTAIVSGAIMGINALLFALYNFWALERVKRSHSRDMQRGNMPVEGEGLREKVERVVNEPPLEPGSVV